MRKYRVLAPGQPCGGMYEAEWYEIDDQGHLILEDDKGFLVAAFAPGVWVYLRPVGEEG